MEKTLFVYIEQSLCSLKGNIADVCFGHRLSFLFEGLHNLIQIPVNVLKDEVGIGGVPNKFFEFDYVWMNQFTQSFDLWQLQTLVPSRVLLFQLFNGYDLFRLLVLSLLDAAESPAAQLCQDPILLHVIFKCQTI